MVARRIRGFCLLALTPWGVSGCLEQANPLWGLTDSGTSDSSVSSTTMTTSTGSQTTSDGSASSSTTVASTAGTETSSGSTGGHRPLVGPFTDIEPVAELNSPQSDDDPTLRADLQEIIFASERDGNEDLYVATRTRPSGTWGESVAITALNTEERESTPELSPDGLTLTFARRTDSAGFELQVATRPDLGASWQGVVTVEELNSGSDDSSLVTSGDGLTAYFCSTRSGAQGDDNIFRASRTSSSQPWEMIEDLVGLNTDDRECTPFVTPDGGILLFASSRGSVEGVQDLFWTTVEGDGFGPAVELEELTTDVLDEDPWLSPDGEILYFARGEWDGLDIYRARRAPP